MHPSTLPLVRLGPLVVLVTSLAAQDDLWPDYRGPGHDGHSTAVGLPSSWSEKENVVWKTRLHGRAWSSPVVAAGEVWLSTASADGRSLSVLVVRFADGKIVHDERLFEIEEPQFAHAFNSYASPSPCIDGDRVYVSFGSPGTACIDRETREVVWQRTDLECNHFRGAGSSPLVVDDLVILTMDGSDHQFVIALDVKDGHTRWRTERSTDFGDLDAKTGKPKMDGDFRKSYATPILIEVDGKPQLISPGAKAAFAYDPKTGAEIWWVRYGNHSSASRAVFGHGLVFLNTGYSRPALLAVDPSGKSDVTKTHIKWRSIRRIPKKPSPLLIGEHLYMLNDQGIASCVEAKTGAAVWNHRVPGEYSASLLYADGNIFAFSHDGIGVLFAPGEKFVAVGENELDGGFMASPAVVGRSLVVRSKTHLYRLEAAKNN